MSRTILVVDDDTDIREIARVAFEVVQGWTVVEAADGATGLAAARAAAPDAILLDYMMPGLDGEATLERIKADETTRNIPVVILTAKVRPGLAEHMQAQGAVGLLPKPFDPMTLGDELAKILGWAA